ncbi:hypothetical protein PV328_012422, partial [Microctonus aethiopoides]
EPADADDYSRVSWKVFMMKIHKFSYNFLVKLNNCNQESIVLKSIPDAEKNQNDNGKIRVWRDSLSPSCLPESKVEVFKQPEEIIIEFDDEQSVVKHHNVVDTVAGMTDENKMSNCLFAVKRKMQQLNKDIKLIYDDTNEYNGSAIIGYIPLQLMGLNHTIICSEIIKCSKKINHDAI